MCIRDVSGIIVCVSDRIFNQKWTLYNDNENESDNADEDNPDIPKSKLRKVNINLDNAFPSRRALNCCFKGAAFVDLLIVAGIMLNKDDKNFAVMVGGTNIAARRHLHDMKTEHISVSGLI